MLPSVSQAAKNIITFPMEAVARQRNRPFPPVPVGEPEEEYRAECAAKVVYGDDDTNDWRLFANAHHRYHALVVAVQRNGC